MKLNLDVLSCCAIKGKRSWKKVTWLGNDINNVVLLDDKKINKVCLSTGQNKKNVNKLQSFQSEIKAFACDPSGLILCGLLRNWKIFLWDADQNRLQWVVLVPETVSTFGTENDFVSIHVSSEADEILLVFPCVILLWKTCDNSKLQDDRTLKGDWFIVEQPEDTIPPSLNSELTVESTFSHNQILGPHIKCSFIFASEGNICIITSLIQKVRWSELSALSLNATLDSRWSTFQIPSIKINPKNQIVMEKGSFVGCYSRDGEVLALAVNFQVPSSWGTILFVSPLTRAIVTVDLNGHTWCRQITTEENRTVSCYRFWISDVEWTSDDAYVVGITTFGLFFMVSRLGSVLLLETQGCSMDMGPSLFLPIHPLVSTWSEDVTEQSGTKNLQLKSSSRQKFSVTCHSCLPLILVSDGYLVSCLEIPSAGYGIGKLSSRLHQEVKSCISMGMTLHSSQNESSRSLFTVKSSTAHSFSSACTLLIHDSIHSSTCTLESMRQPSHNEMNGAKDDVEAFRTVVWDELNITEGIKSFFAAWGMLSSLSTSWKPEFNSQSIGLIDDFLNLVAILLNDDHGITVESLDLSVALQNEDYFIPLRPYYPENVQTLLNVLNHLLYFLMFDNGSGHLLVATVYLLQKILNKLFLEVNTSFKEVVHLLRLGFDAICGFEKAVNKIWMYVSEAVKILKLNEEEMPVQTDCLISRVIFNFGLELNLDHSVVETDQLTGTGLFYACWKMLCQKAASLFIHAAKYPLGDLEEPIEEFLCELQLMIESKGWSLVIFRNSPTSIASQSIAKAFFHGKYRKLRLTLDEWKDITVNTVNRVALLKLSRKLHSLLYGLLSTNQVQEALYLITALLTGYSEEISYREKFPLKFLENKAVLNTIRSFARFFALYFTNHPLMVYPVHHPRKLPSCLEPGKLGADVEHLVYTSQSMLHEPLNVGTRLGMCALAWACAAALHQSFADSGYRMLTIASVDITTSISDSKLEDVLVPDFILELFLITGLWNEAIWFADTLGDQKSALILTAVWDRAKNILNKRSKTPPKISPNHILLGMMKESLKLEALLSRSNKVPALKLSMSSQEEKRHIENDINQMFLSAAVVCNCDPLPSLLKDLVDCLKSCITQLASIPNYEDPLFKFPVFCPQPAFENSPNLSHSELQDAAYRQKVSSIVHAILLLLRAAKLPHVLIKNYVDLISRCCTKLDSVHASLKELQSSYSGLPNSVQNVNFIELSRIKTLFVTFVEFCNLLWNLNIQDQLATSLHDLNSALMSIQPFGKESLYNHSHYCESILKWAGHLAQLNYDSKSNPSLTNLVLNATVEAEACVEVILWLSVIFVQNSEVTREYRSQFVMIEEIWKTKLSKKSLESCVEEVSSDDRDSVLNRSRFFDQENLFSQEIKDEIRELLEEDGFIAAFERCLSYYKGVLQKREESLKNSKPSFSMDAFDIVLDGFEIKLFELNEDYLGFLLMMFDVCFKSNDGLSSTFLSDPIIFPYTDAQRDHIMKSFSRDIGLTSLHVKNHSSVLLNILDGCESFKRFSHHSGADRRDFGISSDCSFTDQSAFVNCMNSDITPKLYTAQLSTEFMLYMLSNGFRQLNDVLFWFLAWQEIHSAFPCGGRKKTRRKSTIKVKVNPSVVLLSWFLMQNKFKGVSRLYSDLNLATSEVGVVGEDGKQVDVVQNAVSEIIPADEKDDFMIQMASENGKKTVNSQDDNIKNGPEFIATSVEVSENLELITSDDEANNISTNEGSETEMISDVKFQNHFTNIRQQASSHVTNEEQTKETVLDSSKVSEISKEMSVADVHSYDKSSSEDDSAVNYTNTTIQTRKSWVLDQHSFPILNSSSQLKRTVSDSNLRLNQGPGFHSSPVLISSLLQKSCDRVSDQGMSQTIPKEVGSNPENDVVRISEEAVISGAAASLSVEQMHANVYPHITKIVQEVGVPLIAGVVGGLLGTSSLSQGTKAVVSSQTQTEIDTVLKLAPEPRTGGSKTLQSEIHTPLQETQDLRTPNPKSVTAIANRPQEISSGQISDNADTLDEISFKQLPDSSEDSQVPEMHLNNTGFEMLVKQPGDDSVFIQRNASSEMPHFNQPKSKNIHKPHAWQSSASQPPFPLLQMPQPVRTNIMANVLVSSQSLKSKQQKNIPLDLLPSTFKKPSRMMDMLTFPNFQQLTNRRLKATDHEQSYSRPGIPLLNIPQKSDVNQRPSARLLPVGHDSRPKKISFSENDIKFVEEYQKLKTDDAKLRSMLTPSHLLSVKIKETTLPKRLEGKDVMQEGQQSYGSTLGFKRKKRHHQKVAKAVGSQCMLLRDPQEKPEDAEEKPLQNKELTQIKQTHEVHGISNGDGKHDLNLKEQQILKNPYIYPTLPASFQDTYAALQHRIAVALENLKSCKVTTAAQTENACKLDANTLTDEVYDNDFIRSTDQRTTQAAEVQVDFDVNQTYTKIKSIDVNSYASEECSEDAKVQEVERIDQSCSPICLADDWAEITLHDDSEPTQIANLEIYEKSRDSEQRSVTRWENLECLMRSALHIEEVKKKSKGELMQELDLMQKRLATLEQQSEHIKEGFDETMQALTVVDKALQQYEALQKSSKCSVPS